MSQIALFFGLILIVLIAFKLMAVLASFLLRIGLLLAVAIAGYVWWQYLRH